METALDSKLMHNIHKYTKTHPDQINSSTPPPQHVHKVVLSPKNKLLVPPWWVWQLCYNHNNFKGFPIFQVPEIKNKKKTNIWHKSHSANSN